MARPTADARPPGHVGMVAVLVGGAAVLVSFIGLDWYVGGGTDSVGGIGFSQLRDTADRLDVPGVVPAYFDWLAWVLLIGVIAVGMLANAPSRASNVLRAVGLVLGAGGAGVTFYALQKIKSYGPEGTYAFHQADLGVWVVLGGFLLAGLGAVVGPRRV